MERSKVESYLGFCLRAGKVVFGVDGIEKQKKGVFLLIVDKSVGESSFKKMQKAREKLSCPLILAEEEKLGAMLYKPAVKAVAIKDKNLAEAIVKALDGETHLKLYSGGTN